MKIGLFLCHFVRINNIMKVKGGSKMFRIKFYFINNSYQNK